MAVGRPGGRILVAMAVFLAWGLCIWRNVWKIQQKSALPGGSGSLGGSLGGSNFVPQLQGVSGTIATVPPQKTKTALLFFGARKIFFAGLKGRFAAGRFGPMLGRFGTGANR